MQSRINVRTIYAGVLKRGNKVWMSNLNKMPEIDVGRDCWVINIEGDNTRGKYFAKRLKLCP